MKKTAWLAIAFWFRRLAETGKHVYKSGIDRPHKLGCGCYTCDKSVVTGRGLCYAVQFVSSRSLPLRIEMTRDIKREWLKDGLRWDTGQDYALHRAEWAERMAQYE